MSCVKGFSTTGTILCLHLFKDETDIDIEECVQGVSNHRLHARQG